MAAVTWQYGHPWSTRTAPYQYLNEVRSSRGTPQPYQSLIRGGVQGAQGEDSGVGAGMPSEARDYGRMTPDQLATLSTITGGPYGWGKAAAESFGVDTMEPGVADTALGTAVNAGAKSALGLGGVLGSAVTGILGGLKAIGLGIKASEWGLNKLGVEREPGTLGLTAAEQQGLADTYGYGQTTPMGQAPGDVTGGVSVGSTGYGTTGPSSVGAPSVGNPDSPFGDSREGGGGGESDADSSGNAGGGGGAGAGGGEERGGVRTTRPGKPRHAIYGEGRASKEGETAIFMPHYMRKSGLQGNERQVRRGLKSAYAGLIR